VLSQITQWIGRLDKNDPRYEHHLLEALWVSWGIDRLDQKILRQLLRSKDYHVRSAAVRAVRYNGHQLKDQAHLLMTAAGDESGRVRLEVLTAASWLDKETGMRILNEVAKKPMDEWMNEPYKAAVAHVNGRKMIVPKPAVVATELKGKDRELFTKGKAIYSRDGFCGTCHQADGKGLPASGFPPLTGTKWVTGSEERLIKIVLHGLHGPIEVAGKQLSGQVPMTAFGRILKNDEIAAVLTYVRNSFGNKASVITPDKVQKVREATKAKTGFYTGEELLKSHPFEN
jgi:mono/diheme cytochrome c family protein